LANQKKNTIVTQHGIMSEEIILVKGLKDKFKFLFKVLIEKYYFTSFTNFIFISNYNSSLFPLKRDHKYAIINNPVNIDFFDCEDNGVERNKIIYIGWISHLKNLILLLKAIYHLKEKEIFFHLSVVGEFKEVAYENQILNYIDQNFLNEDITFKGQLSQEGVLNELKDNGIFVLPSFQENLPISIAEAMTVGNVVVASNVGAVSEMFVNNNSRILFESNNVQELVSILEKLYYDSTFRTSMAERAKNEAKKKYHPDIIAQKTVDFYKTILKN
jgi:glycosyltransferase involved in cell wall biosynthesis